MTVSGTTLNLKFSGKDSVPYINSVEITSTAARALQGLLNSKKNDDKVFDRADAAEVTALLREVVPGISPKTFRTAKGTLILTENLKASGVKASDSMLLKQKALFDASLKTSLTLNHQKNVGKNFKDQEKKAEDRAKDTKESVRAQQARNAEKLKKIKKDLEIAKGLWTGSKLREKTAEFKAKIEKIKLQNARAEERAEKAVFSLEMKKSTSDVAVGTARSSYCDPRVLYSWAADVEMPIEKIYTKSLIGRMSWAEKTPASFWKKYPNV
jgi:DNA topoisomerase-1